MAFNLGDIFVTFKAKTQELENGLKKSAAGIQKLRDETQKGSEKLGKFADGMNSATKKIAGGLAVVGAALTVYAKSANNFTVDYVKNAKLLARETGATVAQSSQLIYALQRVGLSAEDASATFGIFAKKIAAHTREAEANRATMQSLNVQIEDTEFKIKKVTEEIRKNGDKTGELGIELRGLQADLGELKVKLNEVSDPFERIGVKTVDATGKQRDFRDILLDVADRFKAMPAGIDKTALSMELFGRSGKDLIKFLDLGRDGINNLAKEADRLGLTLTPETIGKVAKFIKSQKDLKDQTDAVKIAVGTLTTPVLTKYNETISGLIGRFQSASEGTKKLIANILAFGGPVLTGAGSVLAFGASISQMLPAAGKLIFTLISLGSVLGGLVLLVSEMSKGNKKWGETLKTIHDTGKKALDYIHPKFNALINSFREAIPAGIRLAREVFMPLARLVGTALVAGFGLAIDVANVMIRVITALTGFLLNHKGAVLTVAAAFGILALAMKMDAIVAAFSLQMALARQAIMLMRLDIISFGNNALLGLGRLVTFLQSPWTAAFIAAALVVGAVTAHFLSQKTEAEQLLDAQTRLTEKTNDLKDAQNRLKDSSLNEEGAKLRLEQAQRFYTKAVADFGPESLQARQALHEVHMSERGIEQAAYDAKKAQEDLAKKQAELATQKAIVNHLNEVVGALQRITYESGVAKQNLIALNNTTVTGPKVTTTNAYGRTATFPTNKGFGRARGGLVEEGRPYRINEWGMGELFIPGTNGRIVPNNISTNILEGLLNVGNMLRSMLDQRTGITPTAVLPQPVNLSTTINGNINIGSRADADYLLQRLDRNLQLEAMGGSPR